MGNARKLISFRAAHGICAVLSVIYLASAEASEIHPDWATKVSAGSVTIPSDETWVAYESDMANINTLAAGKLNLLGSLVLDNTTTWFGTNPLTGNGTLVKRGSSTLTGSSGAWSFYGTFIVEGGTFIQTVHYVVDGCRSAKTYVRSGATYRISSAIRLGDVELHVAGTGVDGNGALIVDDGGVGLLSYLELDDDASVVVNCAKQIISAGVPGGRLLCYDPAQVKMNGHKLTVGGTSLKLMFNKVEFVGGGLLTLDGLASAERELESTACDYGTTMVVANGDWLFPAAGFEAPVEITAGNTLHFAPLANVCCNIAGALTGLGGLRFGASDALCTGMAHLAVSNAYEGATHVYGDTDFVLCLGSKYSIPDMSGLDLVGGSLAVAAGTQSDGVTPRWNAGEVLDFFKSQSTSEMLVYTTDATNELSLVISAADVAEYYPLLDVVWGAIGTGLGHYTLVGPYASANPINLNILSGAVCLSGAESIALGNVAVSGTTEGQGGMLILNGAADVVYGDQIITVGSTSDAITAPVARMIVTNSTLRSTYTPSTFADFSTGSLFIGRHATGVLEVEDGAVISNRMVIGGGSSFNTGSGIGAVYQRGGTVRPFSDNEKLYFTAGIGIAGHGSYLLSGGLYRPTGDFNVGGYSSGCFLQTGGTAEYPSRFYMSSHANGKSYYTVLGGATRMTEKAGNPFLVDNNGGLACITVQGEDASFSIKDSQYSILYFGRVTNKDDIARINLNDGGVLELGSIRAYQASYTSENPLVINFNGGILRMGTSKTPFCANSSCHWPKVVVYEKGVQVDAAEGAVDGDNTGARFEAMKEGGIQSINLPSPLSGYPAIPRVDIVGDGDGATAVALVDPMTDSVTNILVTSHGWGYTTGGTIVYLRYASTTKYTFPAASIVIADNEIGGFTKRGTNTFTMLYNNEWEKWTRVLGGTLKMGAAGSIPAGTALTVSNGATLDFNNFPEPTFSSIDGTGGTALNGSIKIVGVDGVLSVSAEKYMSGESTIIAGTIDLTGVSEIRLTNTEVLGENGDRRYLFKATNLVLPQETIAITDVPNKWELRLSDNGLSLSKTRGFVLIVR